MLLLLLVLVVLFVSGLSHGGLACGCHKRLFQSF
jgi:hypothetical protein